MLRFPVLLAVATLSCTAPTQRHVFQQAHMGTEMRLVVYARDEHRARVAADDAFARIAAIERTLTDYDPESEASRLGAPIDGPWPSRWIGVSEDLHRVLLASKEVWRRSEAAFDPTLGPCTRLWRRSRRQGALPGAERLADARRAIGFERLELATEEARVRLHGPGLRLDFGGIAKGYAADEAARVLADHGFTQVLIDAGGDLWLGDAPPGESGWKVALEAPDEPRLSGVQVTLQRVGLATSGSTYQSVVIDGQRYSHLVNPRTGLGCTELRQVNAIAPSAMQADAWASALAVAPRDRALAHAADAGISARLSWRETDGVHELTSPDFPPRTPIQRAPQSYNPSPTADSDDVANLAMRPSARLRSTPPGDRR